MPEHLVFSPEYNVDLMQFGVNKPFALDRGELVLAEIERRFGQDAARYDKPSPLTIEDILLVHTPEYIDSLKHPQTWQQIMEFQADDYFPERAKRPIPELLENISLKSGGTLLAARNALELGLCANLGGGYHHAFPDQGRGYCVIHDIAISIRKLRQEGKIKRALIVDMDFHQGDGSAVIFAQDPDTFTLSVHSQEGWPEVKQISSLDVPIFQGEEQLYLDKTRDGIERALKLFAPDLVLYVAGSDPYEKDVLPGTVFIKLSLAQLNERERLVIDTFADLGIPLASVFAGGYGPHVWEVHYGATRHLLERSGTLIGSQSTHK
jgi:acetoin utilization deacetylase AcuC-like enzyme